MNKEKKNCCKGCKKGQPGKNESCKARLLLEKINNSKKIKEPKTSIL